MLRPQFLPVKILAVLCALIALCLPQTLYSAEQPQYLDLTILYTNDVHGHLFPFDYNGVGENETEVGGAARRAALIRQMKSAIEHPALVMDAGDVFQRGPLDDLRGVPDIEVMNAVPYDIMTLGNNEFRGALGIEGQKVILDRVTQAKFPIISANVVYRNTGKTMLSPYKILDCKGLRVGVFGVTAQRTGVYEQAQGLEFLDPIAAAKSMVLELKDKSDFIVALTHIGFPLDLELAMSVPEIDVIIGGDSHTWLFEPQLIQHEDPNSRTNLIGGTIVCQDGEWGKTLGKLDLKLRLSSDSRYKVSNYKGELVKVDSSITPAKDIEDILSHHTKPYIRSIGKLKKAVPKSEAAAWVAECMRKAAGAQIGIEPNAAIENGLKAGNVSYLDVRKMFPWVNPLVKVKVSGKQLNIFAFEKDSGIAGAQLRDGMLFFNNKAVSDNAVYTLAVEDYYARNSSALAGLKLQPIGLTTREAVIKYITAQSQRK